MVTMKRASTMDSLAIKARLFVLIAFIIAFQTIHLSSKLIIIESTDGPSSIPAAIAGGSSSSDPREIGQILPDGTVTFMPEELQAGRPE